MANCKCWAFDNALKNSGVAVLSLQNHLCTDTHTPCLFVETSYYSPSPELDISMYLFDQNESVYRSTCYKRCFKNCRTQNVVTKSIDAMFMNTSYPPLVAMKWLVDGDDVLFFVTDGNRCVMEVTIISPNKK